jgi:hypothetical protein
VIAHQVDSGLRAFKEGFTGLDVGDEGLSAFGILPGSTAQ